MEEQIMQESKTNGKKKREDKIRKRDNKALENILKAINTLPESEKLQILLNKYSELYDDHRNLQNTLSATEKRATALQREKDQLQTEHNKNLLVRSRLESLCRELQKQNKLIKEQNIAKIREEEEIRKEIANRFQATLGEVTTMMNDSIEKNVKLRDDNVEMSNKIVSLCQQFEKSELDVSRMEKQMSLEKQLSDATKQELKIERELRSKEIEMLKSNLLKKGENCIQLQNNIESLQSHLKGYTGKFEELEGTISKSNKVFNSCKFEMGKMTKQICVLEKELKVWKSRWEKNAKAVLELTATKQTQEAELSMSEKKIDQLQKLCRQLQVDRAAYLKLLKSNGIEASSQMCIDNTPIIPSVQKHQPTKKEQELELLRNNLKLLQEQFIDLQSGGKEKIIAETLDITKEIEKVLEMPSLEGLEMNETDSNVTKSNDGKTVKNVKATSDEAKTAEVINAEAKCVEALKVVQEITSEPLQSTETDETTETIYVSSKTCSEIPVKTETEAAKVTLPDEIQTRTEQNGNATIT